MHPFLMPGRKERGSFKSGAGDTPPQCCLDLVRTAWGGSCDTTLLDLSIMQED